MTELKIPSPGESITEVVLSKWFVENGSYVDNGQELGEIESDKATLPLIAPVAGKLSIVIQAGTTLDVGSVACKIDEKAPKPSNGSEKEKPKNLVDAEKVPIEK